MLAMNDERSPRSGIVPEEALRRVRVVLCRPSHPGNIGSAARAMKNMGLCELWLVEPRRFPEHRGTI